jgi:hypothetical protein
VGLQGPGIDKPLVEAWKGSHWVIQRTPAASWPELDGVSCSSERACTAVGGADRISGAERWDGRTWQLQPTPGVGDISLSAVSCPSATSCIAVGGSLSTRGPAVEHWDGTTWTVSRTPTVAGADLSSTTSTVSCSSTTWCVATWPYGLSSGEFAEQWDGSAWTIRPLPGAPFVYSKDVSCVSATRCIVVGSSWQTENWDGRSWTIKPLPTPAVSGELGLSGVSCVSAIACMAVGGGYAAEESGLFLTVSHIASQSDGTIAFTVHVPASGRIDVMETAWDDNIARAASLLQPAAHRFVVARAHSAPRAAGTVRLLVRPNARGRQLIRDPSYRITLRAWITYTPPGGPSCSIGLYRLHLDQPVRYQVRRRCQP